RGAWFLFAILFLWQFPHFLAIALMYRDDYARAGYRMLPAFDADTRFTRAEILGLTVVCIVVTLMPALGHAGGLYIAAMAASGAFLMYYAFKVVSTRSAAGPSRLVHATVIYLPVVLAILAASKTHY
ncbi:MAG: UbiA family prenyltransferase, partial [Acidobacteria bacterium]|nr:UbiA family prenyltransferase [Acidobacteriota bacterium]